MTTSRDSNSPFSPMTSDQVRSEFLKFFRNKGHHNAGSGPLIPSNDPTLMFANAGMVPFKDFFTGKDTPNETRQTSSQKCIRISGKHNDLENVGVTARHHTFFEMLGNFSFGSYFKTEAIDFAWDLLTSVYKLSPERLVITVFGGDPAEPRVPADDEARALWRKKTGFSDNKIIGMGLADNFWQMGETGPCGPCSEIHYFVGDAPDIKLFGQEPGPDGRGWMEIWNLVFMQFDRTVTADGTSLLPLPKPCVDTGAGLERLVSVIQGKKTNYDTDIFAPLLAKTAEIAGKPYRGSQEPDDVSMRVIADHARAAAFIIAEGVFPDRTGRSYVLRRVMRRAIRHGHRLGIKKLFLRDIATEVIVKLGGVYPELVARQDLIKTVCEQEEERFRETIDRGLSILDDEIRSLQENAGRTLSGSAAFKLYDTYGFPYDLTEVIVKERGFDVDEAVFHEELAKQRKLSEGSKVGDAAVEGVWREALDIVRKQATAGVQFTGYDRDDGQANVLALGRSGALVDAIVEGDDAFVITHETPFYGEAGGQVGDTGRIWITAAKGDAMLAEFLVNDTQKPLPGLIVHIGKMGMGQIRVGEAAQLEVDVARRTAIRRNHSATHLLHWALRSVLGEQSTQKGSLVGPGRLRFDFSHAHALTPEEISEIEDRVNQKVLTSAPIETEVLPVDEAKAKGAMAIFEEKYGDVVRVLTMTSDSVELCGGTHARSLGEIGLFKIVSEAGVAAGVRRIEAVTGINALMHMRHLEGTIEKIARAVRSGPHDTVDKVEKLVERDRAREKEMVQLKRTIALGGGSGGGGVDEMLSSAREIPGGKALAVKTAASDPQMQREFAEMLRDKLGPAVVLVGTENAGKVSLVLVVTKSLTDRYKAGVLIKTIAQKVGGTGGGRPDMAQAGGTEVEHLAEALESLYPLVCA